MKERAKEHVSVNGYGQRVRWEGVGRKISFGILLGPVKQTKKEYAKEVYNECMD